VVGEFVVCDESLATCFLRAAPHLDEPQRRVLAGSVLDFRSFDSLAYP